MKLCIFSIVLDGMPFLQWQYECFKKLSCDWTWIVVEGAAQNNGSTAWCRPQEERLSNDGSHEYLKEIALSDKRVEFLFLNSWKSKDDMVNTAVSEVDQPCILMQIDVDELYGPAAIDKIVKLFGKDPPELGAIKMFCRYFVGPNLICDGRDCWSNNTYEWLRVWRFEPGMFFEKHEPPVMNKVLGYVMPRQEAGYQGLTFDHLAYARREQVAYKEQFYGYDGLLNQWDALQRNTVWPAKLSRFFPFVSGDRPLVRKIGS